MVSRRGSKRGSFLSVSTLSKIQSLLYSRIYLYFILFVSVIYFLGNAINHQYVPLIAFMIISSFTYKVYTKNMSIVLTIGYISSILISYIETGKKEGMKRDMEKEEGDEENEDGEEDEDNEDDEMGGAVPVAQNKTKTKEKLTPLRPTSLQNNQGGDFDVDLASTLEQSYGMLNNLLDNDGISNLTDETKRLINEQKKLFQSMNSMAPLIGQAKEMLGMFNTKDFKQMEGLAESTMRTLNKKRRVSRPPPDDDEDET